MVWETSVTESAKAVGVTNESPFMSTSGRARRAASASPPTSQPGTSVSGDLGGYRGLSAPMTQMIQSGTFYHSSGDVFEQVPAEGLERAARFHAYLIEQADQAPESQITSAKGSPYVSKLGDCASVTAPARTSQPH